MTWFIVRFLFLIGYVVDPMRCFFIHPWLPEISLKTFEEAMDRRMWVGL